MTGADALLDVKDLQVHFGAGGGLFSRSKDGPVKAVDGVSFSIRRGETLGLVGESGCGKSTTGRAVLHLVRPTGGSVDFAGQNLSDLDERGLRAARRQMQMVFQDPYASLNPRMTVGEAIAEPIRVHRIRTGAADVRRRVDELLEMVGLGARFASRYPHEFSGGQRQRIGIARALAVEPSFVVCDEPVSALDVSIQAQVINLLKDLQKDLGLTYLFIAHGLAVVKHISSRVAVMYLGKIVEVAPAADLYTAPAHPYTRSLLSAIPIPNPAVERKRRRIILRGEIPSPINPPAGCRFHTRCPIAIEKCALREPPLEGPPGGHQVACWRAEETAPAQDCLPPLSTLPNGSDTLQG